MNFALLTNGVEITVTRGLVESHQLFERSLYRVRQCPMRRVK
jgi:hypothetical protein